MYTDVIKSLEKCSSKARKKTNEWFFKTGPGEYGEDDKFVGISMPDARKVAKEFREASFEDIQKLLNSPIHEYRMVGLVILTYKYESLTKKSSRKSIEESEQKEILKEKKKIYAFYIKNLKAVNNWDLVDVTTPKVVGQWLDDSGESREILYKLARSRDLWKNRVAILATFPFIKQGDFKDILKLSELLLHHEHDLMHKAIGWMLREVGKISQVDEEIFLQKHYKTMPRTMLRYAIEKFPEPLRQTYLRGVIL